MTDTISAKDVLEARERVLRVAATLPVYLAHPAEKTHLEMHGGGRPDCDTCVGVWLALMARGRT